MSRVLILTNRKPDFFLKFVRIIFADVEEDHDVTYESRTGGVLETTVLFLSSLLGERPDAVVVVGSGFATFFVTVVGRLIPGTTVLFHHNDFTYQLMRDFSATPWWRLQVERIQEGIPLRVADVIGTLTPYHEEYLRDKGLSQPFIRIPHGTYLDEFRPDLGQGVRDELDIDEDALAVCVMGTFNYGEESDLIYGWSLLEALAEIDDESVVGVFIGGGDDTDYLYDRIEELGIEDRTVTTGHVDHEDLPRYLGAMDASLLVKPDHPADKMTTTMKLPEYLAAGTYVITTPHAHAGSILDEDKASILQYEGIRDEAFPGRLATELETLAGDRARVERGQEYARRVAESTFDYEVLQESVKEQIESYLP